METIISEFAKDLYFIKAPTISTVEQLKDLREVKAFIAELEGAGKSYEIKPHDHGLWMLKIGTGGMRT